MINPFSGPSTFANSHFGDYQEAKQAYGDTVVRAAGAEAARVEAQERAMKYQEKMQKRIAESAQQKSKFGQIAQVLGAGLSFFA